MWVVGRKGIFIKIISKKFLTFVRFLRYKIFIYVSKLKTLRSFLPTNSMYNLARAVIRYVCKVLYLGRLIPSKRFAINEHIC